MPPVGWKMGLALIGVIALVVVLFQFGGHLKSWWASRQITKVQEDNTAALQGNKEAEAQLATAQEAIRKMSQQIQQLRDAANKNRAEAGKWQAEAARLGGRVSQLELERRALPPVASLREAQAALKGLGYDLPIAAHHQ